MSLEFTLNHAAPVDTATDCLVVGAFAGGSAGAAATLSPSAQAIDAASGGRLAALIARGDINGKTGTVLALHDLPGLKAPRVLVVGLGEAGAGLVRRSNTSRSRRAWSDEPAPAPGIRMPVRTKRSGSLKQARPMPTPAMPPRGAEA
jgi:hypothetical protein